MKFTRLFSFFVAIISCVFLFTGCITIMVNAVQKNRESIGRKAILEVEEDRFITRLPALTVEVTSPCPIGFVDYLKEDFRKNISGTNGKPSGSVLMMVEDTAPIKDSVGVKLTMYIFRHDSSFLKSYSAVSVMHGKEYIKQMTIGKKISAVHPIYTNAYASIRSTLKKDAELLVNKFSTL